jgi:galactokinase
MGIPIKGLNFSFTGDIPQQIGLSSSLAIEIAAAVAIRAFYDVKISDLELARKLSGTHLQFFGKDSGLVNYLAGLMARSNQFVVIDELSSAVTRIKSPFVRCKFIVMDSRVPRFGAESELNARREDIKQGLEMLSQGRGEPVVREAAARDPAVRRASFRDFAAMDLIESMGNLPEEIRRRSLHVVQEIRRVLVARDYLERGDLSDFSRLIFNSHESLRDLYEISCPEIDWVIKRSQETAGVYGARMTGQGFGGCTYTIIKKEMVDEYRNRIEEYERIFGFNPAMYEVKLATGARICAP